MKRMLAYGLVLGLVCVLAIQLGLTAQERYYARITASQCAVEYLATANADPERAKRCYTARGLDAPW